MNTDLGRSGLEAPAFAEQPLCGACVRGSDHLYSQKVPRRKRTGGEQGRGRKTIRERAWDLESEELGPSSHSTTYSLNNSLLCRGGGKNSYLYRLRESNICANTSIKKGLLLFESEWSMWYY